MNLTLYTDVVGFEELKAEWNDLLHRSRYDTIFLTWEWQTTWWRHLGAEGGSLHLLAMRDAGRLVGILPLYTKVEAGQIWLRVVGCVDVSDYLDFIVEVGQEEAVYRAFLHWLAGAAAPAWDVVDLCNQPAVSLAHEVLPAMAAASGYITEVSVEDVCPAIALPRPCDCGEPDCEDAWETYLGTLDKKERHEIRRKLRRMEREAPDCQVRCVTGGPALQPAIDAFIALHRFSRADKHAFMTEQMQSYFQAIARVLADQGWLQLSFLDVGGQPVATYFCFDYRNDILVYNSGYDPAAVPQLSPGWVLLARLIQDAIGRGRARFDFLQGNEDYKYRFGGVDTLVYSTKIRRAARMACE